MRRYALTLLAVATLMVIAASTIGAAERRRSKLNRDRAKAGLPRVMIEVLPKPAPPNLPPRLPAGEIPAVPSLRLGTSPRLKADRETLQLHQQAAALISEANPIPDHRTRHFRWISGNTRWRLLGWGGFVRDVEPAPGGYRVTIQVSPLMTEDNRSATTADYTLETYLISNGQVQFIQGIDPPDALPGGVLTD